MSQSKIGQYQAIVVQMTPLRDLIGELKAPRNNDELRGLITPLRAFTWITVVSML